MSGTDRQCFGYISLIVTTIRGRQRNTDYNAWNAKSTYRHTSWGSSLIALAEFFKISAFEPLIIREQKRLKDMRGVLKFIS